MVKKISVFFSAELRRRLDPGGEPRFSGAVHAILRLINTINEMVVFQASRGSSKNVKRLAGVGWKYFAFGNQENEILVGGLRKTHRLEFCMSSGHGHHEIVLEVILYERGAKPWFQKTKFVVSVATGKVCGTDTTVF